MTCDEHGKPMPINTAQMATRAAPDGMPDRSGDDVDMNDRDKLMTANDQDELETVNNRDELETANDRDELETAMPLTQVKNLSRLRPLGGVTCNEDVVNRNTTDLQVHIKANRCEDAPGKVPEGCQAAVTH